MMLFARPPVPEPERIDLAKLAAKLIDELTPEADALGTTLMLHAPPPPVWIWADPIQWAVALRAILVNAIEAIGSGGRVEMSVRRVDAGDVRGASDATQASRPRHADPAAPVESPSCASADRGTSAGTSAVAAATSIAQGVLEPRAGASPAGTVEIAIRDNGPGMDERAARHLFDPFFSGREAGRGLGFGLSKAWRIITAHDGEIDVDTRPGFGTTFTIRTGSAGT
jgi:signal transduction histidine kinase